MSDVRTGEMGGADQVAVNHVLDLFKIDDLGETYFTSGLSDFDVSSCTDFQAVRERLFMA